MKRSLRLFIIISPVIVLSIAFGQIWGLIYVMFLGLSGLGRVLYSALNFNNCEDDAESLRKEVIEAKAELSRRGFKFETN